MVKKLRYYARFIVVCLLLNKMDLVKALVKVSHGHQTDSVKQRFSSQRLYGLKNNLCFCVFVPLQELSEEIEDYTQRFNTEDQLEWNLVLQEVAAFVEVFLFWIGTISIAGLKST